MSKEKLQQEKKPLKQIKKHLSCDGRIERHIPCDGNESYFVCPKLKECWNM